MSKERTPDDGTVGDDYGNDTEVGDDYRDDSRLLDRRGYLKMAGAAAAAVATGSTAGAAAGGMTRHGIEFDRVLDAVDDLGLDPSGNEAVNDRLDAALSEGTLVRFPEGEYRFDGEIVVDADRVGVLGEGDVRFVPTTGYTGLLFNYDPVPDDVLIESVDVDMRADGTTTGIRLRCRNRFHIEDIEFLGRGLTDNSGQVSAFLLGITSESGRGVLRNAVAKKGSRADGYARGNGRIGVWVGWTNKGTVRIEGCDFREFGNNGTYTSRTPGQVEIVDCYFLNNNAANVRIGGAGSYIENCTIEIDFEKYTGPELGDISTGWGMRGIQIEQGVQLDGAESIPAGAEVRNCELVGRNAPNGIAMVNLSPQGRSLSIEDTRIRTDIGDMWAVRRGRPGTISWREWQETAPKPHWIRMENVSITGSASGREAVRLVEADDSVVRNCCIHQPGSNRDGVNFVDADGGVVEDSTIDVTGREITLENSTASSSSITRDGSCPFPDPQPASSGSTDDSTSDSTDDTTSDSTSDSTSTGTNDGQELVIDGSVTYDRVNYTFEVDGSVEAGPRANGSDTIDGTTVSGHVEGGVDSFWVTGEFTDFQMDGDVPIRLDGETVAPSNLVSEETTESTDESGRVHRGRHRLHERGDR
ncbi:right-handed parallel beta-helix repeat-containing protein, partial [Halorubrum sp. CBA1125]|uniref:right-handed parallel beta-helix repeat-containing protein n=1 Tax=Halorubrum sp. CBA1125 TaxID=2668072 RepID=UPI0026E597CF